MLAFAVIAALAIWGVVTSKNATPGSLVDRINVASDKVLKSAPIFAAIHLAPLGAHEFEAILFRCSDGRYGDNTRKSVRQALKTTSFDDISVPGGPLALVDPLHKDDKEFVLRQFDLLKKLHKNKIAIFQGHTKGCENGCSAMGAKYPELKEEGVDPEEQLKRELKRHVEVQLKAAEVLQKLYPDIKVVMSVIKPVMKGKYEIDEVYRIH